VLTSEQPTRFELGRMPKLDLMAEYFRHVPTIQGGSVELRMQGLSKEAITTLILNQRERTQCPS
jgi:hypothetical protein